MLANDALHIRMRTRAIAPAAIVAAIIAVAQAAKAISDLLAKADQQADFQKIGTQLAAMGAELVAIEGQLDTIVAALAEMKVLIQDLPAQQFVAIVGGYIDDCGQYYGTWAHGWDPHQHPAIPPPGKVYQELHDAANFLRDVNNSYAHYSAIGLAMIYERALLHLPSLSKDLNSSATRNTFADYLAYFRRAIDASDKADAGSIGKQNANLAAANSALQSNIDARGVPLLRDSGVLYGYRLNGQGGMFTAEVIQIIGGTLATGFSFTGDVLFMNYNPGPGHNISGVVNITPADLLTPGTRRIDAWAADLDAMHATYIDNTANITVTAKAIEDIGDLIKLAAGWSGTQIEG